MPTADELKAQYQAATAESRKALRDSRLLIRAERNREAQRKRYYQKKLEMLEVLNAPK